MKKNQSDLRILFLRSLFNSRLSVGKPDYTGSGITLNLLEVLEEADIDPYFARNQEKLHFFLLELFKDYLKVRDTSEYTEKKFIPFHGISKIVDFFCEWVSNPKKLHTCMEIEMIQYFKKYENLHFWLSGEKGSLLKVHMEEAERISPEFKHNLQQILIQSLENNF